MTETIVEFADREIALDLPRFGACTYRESEVLAFPWGLPGFATLHRFVALTLDGQEKFIWLQSLDDLSIARQLGLTRQQIINLRKSARARLSRRLGEKRS